MSSSLIEFDDNNTKENKETEAKLFLDFNDFKNKYIENSLKESENDSDINEINNKQDSLIKKLETELYFLKEENKAIYFSNEEMSKYSSKLEDEDINECRAENMKILFTNFERMKEIQKEILNVDSNHNVKCIDLSSMIDKTNEEDIDYKDPKNNPLIIEFIDRSDNNNINDAEFNKEFDDFFYLKKEKEVTCYNQEEIIQEIDL